MSNNTNTELAERLEDLKEEVKDCQSSYDSDFKDFENARKNKADSELRLYKARVALLEFQQRLYNDN